MCNLAGMKFVLFANGLAGQFAASIPNSIGRALFLTIVIPEARWLTA
jgi:hypothetical protein